MTDNRIDDEGVNNLCEMLKWNTTLTRLNLQCEEKGKEEKCFHHDG